MTQAIHRREAVQRITLLLGGILSTQLAAGLMGQVLHIGAGVEVSAEQRTLLAEAADTILPATDTPGAKAAGVEQFIVRMLRDCYRLEDQEKFYAGLARLDADSQARHGKSFTALDAPTRNEVMRQTAKDNKAFFLLLKELTVAGYFTSEIGATKALEYLPIPGRFQGDLPLKPEQKAWAI